MPARVRRSRIAFANSPGCMAFLFQLETEMPPFGKPYANISAWAALVNGAVGIFLRSLLTYSVSVAIIPLKAPVS
jgi:hypothetical protein